MRQTYDTLDAVAADRTLNDDDVVRSDDPDFHMTVGELRAAVAYHDDKRHARAASANSYPAPDPYRADVERLRTASATSESSFEERWKAERREALAAESRRRDEHIKALQAKERR